MPEMHREFPGAPQAHDTGRRDRVYGETDPNETVDGGVVDAMRGWSSFENLFRISPVPIMEQDYSALVDWMDRLRAQGVSDIRKHLGDEIEAIRAVVPLIRIVAAKPVQV